MGDNSGCPGHILTFTECQTNLHTLLCRKCDIVNYPASFWLSQQCLCPTTHTMVHSHTFHLIGFFILKIKPLTPKPPSAPLAWKNPAPHPILHLPRGTRSSVQKDIWKGKSTSMQMKCKMKGPKLCNLPSYPDFPQRCNYECLSSFPLAKLY